MERQRTRAVLDANVLYVASIRDYLLHLAYTTHLYEPLWTDEIHMNLYGQMKSMKNG
jgi:hypothetical protein